VSSLSLAIGYPTLVSVPHSLINGFKNLLSLAAVTDIEFKEAQTVIIPDLLCRGLFEGETVPFDRNNFVFAWELVLEPLNVYYCCVIFFIFAIFNIFIVCFYLLRVF